MDKTCCNHVSSRGRHKVENCFSTFGVNVNAVRNFQGDFVTEAVIFVNALLLFHLFLLILLMVFIHTFKQNAVLLNKCTCYVHAGSWPVCQGAGGGAAKTPSEGK